MLGIQNSQCNSSQYNCSGKPAFGMGVRVYIPERFGKDVETFLDKVTENKAIEENEQAIIKATLEITRARKLERAAKERASELANLQKNPVIRAFKWLGLITEKPQERYEPIEVKVPEKKLRMFTLKYNRLVSPYYKNNTTHPFKYCDVNEVEATTTDRTLANQHEVNLVATIKKLFPGVIVETYADQRSVEHEVKNRLSDSRKIERQSKLGELRKLN